MNKSDFYENYFNGIFDCLKSCEKDLLTNVRNQIIYCSERGGKVLLFGNGGSAAMASHVSVDLVKAARIRAVNFNEADLLTCFSNDYGYEHWVQKCIEFYADDNDLIILISSSGQSENMINAAKLCKELNLNTITLTGFESSNPLRGLGDVNLYVPSSSYNYVEMTHHIWLLSVVDLIIQEQKN